MVRVVKGEKILGFGERGLMSIICLLEKISNVIMAFCQKTIHSEKRIDGPASLNNNLLCSGRLLPTDIVISYIKIEQRVVSAVPEKDTIAKNISGDVKAFGYIKIINLFSNNFIEACGLERFSFPVVRTRGFYFPDALLRKFSYGVG